ncbi:MAG: SusC/RagA family TonB-linked outer membrane protein, partial [Dysgonamonadaceae bacterium]|nr:SusC/RagA family TonB-linked outer membrane protein [Dysgonamonadaceae bacterium]
GYLNNEGIIKGDAFAAIRSRLNLDVKVTDWIKVGMNTQFTNRDESVVQGNLGRVASSSPYGSMYNENGTLKTYTNDYAGTMNPLEDYYGQDRLRDINSLFSNLYAELNLGFGITYKISYQPHFEFTKDFNYWSTETYTGNTSYTGGYGRRDNNQTFGWALDNLLKWDKEFGVHAFDVTLLANAEKELYWSSRQYSSNFAPNENLGYHALQFGANPGLSNNDTQVTGDALMGRLNYTLMNKYLFTGSIRRDGYSAFGQENPRATFPALAFAWKIDDEEFYNISWMNRLKLRLSWGENGNRSIGGYSALAQMGSVLYYNGNNVQTGVYNSSLANTSLRWERTESFNIGLDIGLFNNRVDMTIDVYDATTKDLLLNRQLPRVTGFNSITSNLGLLGNRGIEATINSVNITNRNFTWKSGFVFSVNRNKIKELWGDTGDYKLLNEDRSGELPDFQNQWFPGYARDIIWDYERIGIWQVNEAEEAAKYGLEPGDYKAVDVNDDGKYTQFEDKKFIGYTAPRVRLGLRNEFQIYKNLTASIFIRADLGHMRLVPIGGDKSTHDRRNDWGFDYWSPENPNSEFPMILYPDNHAFFGGGIRPFVSTAFLRVQDLNVSYNVPLDKLQRILPFNSLRVSLSARNLYTITNWPGFDPESGNSPMPKTFTFGLDITL